MRLLPKQLRNRAYRRNKIQLIQIDHGLWAWSCPWCQVWGEGATWEVTYGHMFRHHDLIHT